FSEEYEDESDLFERESNNFIRDFVLKIFSGSNDITQEEKAKFGVICQAKKSTHPKRNSSVLILVINQYGNRCVIGMQLSLTLFIQIELLLLSQGYSKGMKGEGGGEG
ncbi:hypothetical protein QZH41_019398, partial [Actinostola sp. cb2023]